MKKILVFLFFSLLVSSCGTGSGPVRATSLPATEAETEVSAEPTAALTEVPTATSAPTEVPYYTGKTVEEIAKLREQCLATDPTSLCLPLPFEPAGEGEIFEIAIHPKIPEYTHRLFRVEIPQGAILIVGWDGELVELTGGIAGTQEIRNLNPERSAEGLRSISFSWAPYLHWECSDCFPTSGDEPSLIFTIRELAYCGVPSGEGSALEDGDLEILASVGFLSSGQPLARVNVTGLCLSIGSYIVAGLEQYIVSDFEENDLLRDEFGSIVFVIAD